ncbi:MAG TPA: N-6 DNA methylase, partial [Bryobacteraceae bacterium]
MTGEIRGQIDSIWNDFWTGGVSNPLAVIEQITYLLFIKRLDEIETNEEKKSAQLKTKMERRLFPQGKDKIGKHGGCAYSDMRWSRFKAYEPRRMFEIVDEHVFPFLRTLANGNHMKDARNGIPTSALLAKVVDKLDRVDMADRDTKGDVYEYMLAKIASAGQNGQFRTPRHIIALMVELVAPTPKDTICDPAVGTAGFLVAAGEYLRRNHPEIFRDAKLRRHFHETMFTGYDFDSTMLRIASMNMVLHGIEHGNILYQDSLSEDRKRDNETYSV